MKAVGARLPRYDGVGHVTGRTQYVDDVRVGRTLWVKALRSPHHHAAITSLDTSEGRGAEGRARDRHARRRPEERLRPPRGPRRPGATSRCSPTTTCATRASRSPPSPPSRRRPPCAAVEAIEIALRGARPRSSTSALALDPEAPQIHQWGNVYPHYGPYNHRRVRKGDIDWAFDEADLIVEGVYRPQAIEQMPLETQVALAVPEPSGRLTIYSCTQAMYFSMGVVAAHLQVPLNKLKFVGGTVGGGFGGKVDTATETICALLALKSRRPVKWRWTREEEFLASSTRAPVAHRARRRGHEGRLDPRPADADAARLRRVRALLAVRRHEARVPPLGRLHDPEPALRRLRRLHEPRADDRDARLRRHVGVVRGRDAHEPHRRRARDRPVGAAPEEREPHRRHERQRRRRCKDPSTVPVTLAAAERVGIELPAASTAR